MPSSRKNFCLQIVHGDRHLFRIIISFSKRFYLASTGPDYIQLIPIPIVSLFDGTIEAMPQFNEGRLSELIKTNIQTSTN